MSNSERKKWVDRHHIPWNKNIRLLPRPDYLLTLVKMYWSVSVPSSLTTCLSCHLHLVQPACGEECVLIFNREIFKGFQPPFPLWFLHYWCACMCIVAELEERQLIVMVHLLMCTQRMFVWLCMYVLWCPVSIMQFLYPSICTLNVDVCRMSHMW